MSLISPTPQGTNIKLYKGIPWDSTIENIRWFSTTSERNTFLAGKLAGTWDSCSVVKTGKAIRVQALYNNCIDCNYLSFVNPDMGDTLRTYYAWVTSVNYINVQTVELEYQIDWIQTYLFEFVFESCLVEREHVDDDTLGKHVLEEGQDFGEYQVERQKRSDFQSALILTYFPDDGGIKEVDNIAVCGAYRFATLSNQEAMDAVNEILVNNAATPEKISSIFMCVADMMPINDSGFFSKSFDLNEEPTFLATAGVSGAGSYTPQNKKLLCYPYKFLAADNFNGSVQQYRWELCNTPGEFEGIINGNCIPKPSMHFFPVNYRRTHADSTQTNNYKQEGLWYDNFPACNYVSDTFRAWVSQFGVSYAVEKGASVLLSVAGTVGSVMTGNIAGGIAGGASLVGQGAGIYNDIREKQIHSLQSHGSVGQSGLNFADYDIGFRLTAYSISIEDAKRIDKFFNRYGYRVDAVKIPNVTGRQYVNYVKCQSGHVGGNISIDAKLAMEKALSQGTSFWHIDNIDGDLTSNPIVTS